MSDDTALIGIAAAFVGTTYIAYVSTNPGGDGALLVAIITPITSIVSALLAYRFGKKKVK